MAELKRLLFASTNPGKLIEVRSLVAGLPVRVVSLAELPPAPPVEEDRDTFRGNAMKKALELRDFHHLATLADDSGLRVDALDGAPGVLSARFAVEEPDHVSGPRRAQDEANIRKLLGLLAGIPSSRRQARFVCALCFAPLDGEPTFADGECAGVISDEPRGSGGFGYDPVFLMPSLGRTFAELSPEEKNQLSHRRQALDRLRPTLAAWAG